MCRERKLCVDRNFVDYFEYLMTVLIFIERRQLAGSKCTSYGRIITESPGVNKINIPISLASVKHKECRF